MKNSVRLIYETVIRRLKAAIFFNKTHCLTLLAISIQTSYVVRNEDANTPAMITSVRLAGVASTATNIITRTNDQHRTKWDHMIAVSREWLMGLGEIWE